MYNLQDYAIVIGINDYKKLQPLKGSINDAKAFKAWLLAPDGGNIPKSNCFYLSSDSKLMYPSQDKIDTCLDEIYEIGQKNGFRRLYFYFAGHGLGVTWNENALCLPRWSDRMINHALSSSEYLKTIVESGFKEVFFFLDCCRNRRIGTRAAHPYIGWSKPNEATSLCSSFVAYATEFDNAAYEFEELAEDRVETRGYFTKALILGLKGAASNNSGIITTNSLKSFLKTKVEELAKLNNHKQYVRFEDNFVKEEIILKVSKTTSITLIINFKQAGNIILDNPVLEIIKQGSTVVDDSWILNVEKGIYGIRNINNGCERYIKIDGTINPYNYVF